MPGRILIVDDDPAMTELLRLDLAHRDFTPVCADSAEAAFQLLGQQPFDVVLTDLAMPGMGGIELCDRIAANHPDLPVVVLTGFGSLETAVAAIRSGAYDFVTKPVDLDLLHLVINRAARHHELQEQVRTLSAAVERSQRFETLLGASPAMQRLFDELARVAALDTQVLITGENGTGKELAARALHARSPRAHGPFIAVNCAALPHNLLESELFGHVRGAFTDARSARSGLFAEAAGGTLLLDEIGDFPLELQPKLLRVLEQRTLRPVGADREVPFDVRVIAATNRDLQTAIEERRFREDLFFRINVIQIELPPLRARGTDVLLLAQHFVDHFADRLHKPVTGISQPVAERLLAYAWPGNVRELRNAVERAVALTQREKLVVEDLPERIRAYRSAELSLGGENPGELATMEEVERRYIRHVLNAAAGNKTVAARILGFDRKTLYRKLERYGIETESN
ncbi:MAG TPA: sigma-54 dependent transcriptional regulator [Phycisphaerae bacterium]|nr:sigma-54-dependent Fis family transcriptional regulator [Phycisphaerales bacterium]HRX85883.1 sigma-54 dependent transcriptional regulator [Phycisphaerae bacterium]